MAKLHYVDDEGKKTYIKMIEGAVRKPSEEDLVRILNQFGDEVSRNQYQRDQQQIAHERNRAMLDLRDLLQEPNVRAEDLARAFKYAVQVALGL